MTAKRLQRLKNQRKELEKQQEAIWGYKGDIKQLKQENEQLKNSLNFCKRNVKRVNDDKKELIKENERLKSENNMLRVTIGRNEAYIDRLTHKSVWSNKSVELRE